MTGRNILFVTTDQQRYDSLGCNGNTIARTPVADSLASEGVNYRRAYNQNTVCMPARSTMLTGQYVRTHGVVANGIALPEDAPSVAAYLSEAAGYRTALLGKAHFEPGFDLMQRFEENKRPARGDTGPWRGFDVSVQAMHVAGWQGNPIAHYGKWLLENHPEHMESFASLLGAQPGGDTGAPETKNNPIPRGWYHTDWIADLTVGWLDSLGDDERWFCWMSFPDPHHPWDPPASELSRVPWQDLDLPPGHPGSDDKIRQILSAKPEHWLAWWDGTWANVEGGPGNFFPGRLNHDQIREINAKVHVMNELIDEACGRVLSYLAGRGWTENTDVIFTTDHGELQGDFGFVYKGPFHVDALMRLPLIWRPAPSAGIGPAEVHDPVGQVDLAPTFCAIAGVEPAPWMQGRCLPVSGGDRSRQRMLCEWDSQFPGYGMHLRSIYRDGWLCTVYEPSTAGKPNGLEKALGDSVLTPSPVVYEGSASGPRGVSISTGELYDVDSDPYQWDNRWDDRTIRSLRDDLVEDLYEHLPSEVRHLPVDAPAYRRLPALQALRTPDDRFTDLPDYGFQPHYVQVADGEGAELRIHYLDEGPSGGAVVLLMHGEPSWCYLYRRMIPSLTEAGLRCIAPDLVGFGRSDKPVERSDYTYARHVSWMREALFERLGLDEVTLLGQDWGGLIGLRLVAENPERFARVVLANSGLPTGDQPLTEAFMNWQRFSQETPVFHVGGIVKGGCSSDLAPEVVAAYDAPFPDDRYTAGARTFPVLVPTTPEDPAAGANRKAWETLSELDKPFLTAFSDGDPVTRGGERIFQRLVPGARGQPHTTIRGAGHFLQEDKGPELAEVVREFVTRTSS